MLATYCCSHLCRCSGLYCLRVPTSYWITAPKVSVFLCFCPQDYSPVFVLFSSPCLSGPSGIWAHRGAKGETGSYLLAQAQFSHLQNSQPVSPLLVAALCDLKDTVEIAMGTQRMKEHTPRVSREEAFLIDFKRTEPGAILTLERFTRNVGRIPRQWCWGRWKQWALPTGRGTSNQPVPIIGHMDGLMLARCTQDHWSRFFNFPGWSK